MRTGGTKQTRLAALHLLTLLTHHSLCNPETLAPSLPLMLPMVAAVATAGKLAQLPDEIGFARYVALRKLLLLLAANVLVLARQLAEAAAEQRGGEALAESWVELRQRQLEKKMRENDRRAAEYDETGASGGLGELFDRILDGMRAVNEREISECIQEFERQQKEAEQQRALVGVALRLLFTSCFSLQMVLCVMSYTARDLQSELLRAAANIARRKRGSQQRAASAAALAGDTVHVANKASLWLCHQVDEVGMFAVAAGMPPSASEEEALDWEHQGGPVCNALFAVLNAARGPVDGVDCSVGACMDAAAGAFVEAMKAVPKLPQVLLEGAWTLEKGEDTPDPCTATPLNCGGGEGGGRASLGCSSSNRGGGSRGSKQEPAAAAGEAREVFWKIAVVSSICSEGCKQFPSGIYCNHLMCPWVVGPSELGILAGRRKGVGGMCGVCKTAVYCSRDCQMEDWEAGHGSSCRRRGG